MFTDEHLNDVRKVARSLLGHCSYGMSHAYKKGLCSSIFDMWLVRNRIANLVLLPLMENYRFCVIYDTLKS